MAIVTLNASDSGTVSRGVINDNFTDLDTTKADLASPTFTGTPTLPTGTIAVTQSASDNSTRVATTAYVDSRVTASFPATQVYSGAAPTGSYADLDLSATIGSTQRIVYLKVVNGTTVGNTFRFRQNGEATSGQVSGSSASDITGMASGTLGHVLVCTDTNGIVEWIASGGAGTTTVTVLAYW